ncbi:MAG: lysozyme [Alistipes senegalensis]|nr:lysozyme [Alistipes senegalensis]
MKSNKKRISLAALYISAACLVGIAGYEGYRGQAYMPTPNDRPTIGFGETKGVRMGDKTTPERALVQLLKSTQAHAEAIRSCISVPLYQHEWDAYVSLAYNIGTGNFCKSTLVKKLNAEDYAGACKEILRWDRQAGKTLPGLIRRRQGEYATCIGK